MTFNDIVTKAIKDIESLNKDVVNIKNYKLIENFTLLLIICIFFTFLLNIFYSILPSFILSSIGTLFYGLINIIFPKKLFKELEINAYYTYIPFYNRIQKKEIHEKYKNLDKDTKFALNKTANFYGSIETHLFLEKFLFYYIIEKSISNEYKSLITFISETEYDIDKKIFFIEVLDKLIQEDSSFYKKSKDELVDYIYNSNLKNKKLILSLIKEHIKNYIQNDIEDNYDVDSLYNEISDFKIKKEQNNTMIHSL